MAPFLTLNNIQESFGTMKRFLTLMFFMLSIACMIAFVTACSPDGTVKDDKSPDVVSENSGDNVVTDPEEDSETVTEEEPEPENPDDVLNENEVEDLSEDVQSETEDPVEGQSDQGRCQGKSSSRTGQQAENAEQVDALANRPVGMPAQQGAAGLGEALAVAVLNKEHIAVTGGGNDKEAPGNSAPVEHRVGGRPQMLLRIGQDAKVQRYAGVVICPLMQGEEKNIRRHGSGENHGTPGEVTVAGLFKIAQLDLAALGEGDIQPRQEKEQTNQDIIPAKGIRHKGAHRINNLAALLGKRHQHDAQRQNDAKRHNNNCPVNSTAAGSIAFVGHKRHSSCVSSLNRQSGTS